jgi:hypothetical protein
MVYVDAMENVGNVFGLPFRSGNWLGTFALMGLIGLIPILGQIALLGWTLALLDNYRRGAVDLPPPGFQYLGRGVNLFLVFLVYGLVIALIIGVPFLVLIAGSLATAGNPDGRGAYTSGLAGSGFSAFGGVIELLVLVLYLFYPAVIVATERGGIAAGLNPANVLRVASVKWSNTLVAGLLVYVGFFIAQLGICACCVGLIFTLPYGYAVLAGVVRYYEASLEGPTAVPPPQPPPPGYA